MKRDSSASMSITEHIIDIRPGMSSAERVGWVTARAAKLGITAPART